eukprot:1137191-Pelagomonas_calceolata.AAC.3
MRHSHSEMDAPKDALGSLRFLLHAQGGQQKHQAGSAELIRAVSIRGNLIGRLRGTHPCHRTHLLSLPGLATCFQKLTPSPVLCYVLCSMQMHKSAYKVLEIIGSMLAYKDHPDGLTPLVWLTALLGPKSTSALRFAEKCSRGGALCSSETVLHLAYLSKQRWTIKLRMASAAGLKLLYGYLSMPQ